MLFFSFRAKYAVNSIKKKVNDKNPHVALYALEVIRALLQCLLVPILKGLFLLLSGSHAHFPGHRATSESL